MRDNIVRFFIVVRKYHDQKQLERSLPDSSMELRPGTQGRNLKAGAEAEAMEEFGLLPCSSWLAQSAFSYNPVPHA